LTPTPIIRSSRYQASRAPSWRSEPCTRSLPRPSVPKALWLASPSPRWPCSDGTLSRLCSVCCSPILCATFVYRADLVLQCCDCAVGCSPDPMRTGRPCAAVSAPSASDARCDSRSPHRCRWRRMRYRLLQMKSDYRSARQAMQLAMNRGLFCSSPRRRRLRQSPRRHTDGAYDSPCSWEVCAVGQHEPRDHCCRSGCAAASCDCSGRKGLCPASPCASRSLCDPGPSCPDSAERTTNAAFPRSAGTPDETPCPG